MRRRLDDEEDPRNPRIRVRYEGKRIIYTRKKPLQFEGEYPNMNQVFRDWERFYEMVLFRYFVLNGKRCSLQWRMKVRGVRLPMTEKLILKYGGEGVTNIVWTRLYVDGSSIPFFDPPLQVGDIVFVGDVSARIHALDRFGIDGSFVKLILVSDATDARRKYSKPPKPPKNEEWEIMRDISTSEMEEWKKKTHMDHFKKV